VLVKGHGGPTSAASSTLSLSTQYWTSRGIGVLDVNDRGSTGYGRPYRLRLERLAATATVHLERVDRLLKKW
jgi:dipeptidyl aminopeptidase/acylaminoacyl peptidase